jgi:prepilin-type N-terminal cleavage/methylation domain-containing protein
MKNKKSGYTLIELMVCIIGIFGLLGTVAVGYILFHFISKIW